METKYSKIENLIKERNSSANHKSITGYKGVSIRKDCPAKPFVSKFIFRHNNSKVDLYLGNYTTAEEAHIARIKFIDSLK